MRDVILRDGRVPYEGWGGCHMRDGEGAIVRDGEDAIVRDGEDAI